MTASSATAAAPDALAKRFDEFRNRFFALRVEISKAIVGNDELITDTLAAIFCQGHALLEGVPGLGKTSLVRALSRVLGVTSGRVQCTPDLMPADVLGTHIVGEDEHGRRSLRWERGPVFHHLVLVDEINRATPKTQAALLEVMQERQVTAGSERHVLPAPFFVLATQNPVEMEGTYPLPEAQLDRFTYKLRVPFPAEEQLMHIARRTAGFNEQELSVSMQGDEVIAFQELVTQVPAADPILRYATALVLASHPEHPSAPPAIKRFVGYGASPRGVQSLVRTARVHCLLAGRSAVATEDIRRVAKPSLRHRLIRNFEGEAEGVDGDKLVDELLAAVPGPEGK